MKLPSACGDFQKQQLWDYNSPAWAAKFLDEWCRQTIRSRIEPMKKIARSLRQHRELISTISALKSSFPAASLRASTTKPKSPEKILRLPYLPCPRTRPLSLTWQAARAGIHPRFFLTSPKNKHPGGHRYLPRRGIAPEAA